MIAAIYSRKSKQSEKGESIENQIELCKEYASKNLNITDFLIYEDEGFSGGNTKRPEFQRMLQDAKKKKFNALICYRLDRISRNVADFSNTIEEMQKLDIDFVSIREQFDTSTPMGRAMMNIAAVFAQLERETIAERISDNMLELSKTGRWLGGTAPLGYKSQPVEYTSENGKNKKMFKLVQVSEELKIVKLIYELYLEKKSFNSVASYLCKNHYKGKKGGEFSKGTVEQIIKNPVYCISDKDIFDYFKKEEATTSGAHDNIHGLMVYNKREGGKKLNPISKWIVSVGKHEGTLSSHDWIKCQNIIKENKSKASPRSGTGDKFLLSGMIVCGECGSGMSSWSHYNKKRDYMERYYRCNLRNRAATRCCNKMLNAYKAEDYVLDNLKNLDMAEIIKKYDEMTKKTIQKNNLENELKALQKDKEKNIKTIQGLIRKLALLDDDLDLLKMIKDEIENIKIENSNIDKLTDILIKDIDEVNDIEYSLDEFTSKFETYKKFIDYVDTVEDKRLLISSIVENIVWNSESEKLEINLIGSKKKLPNGKVRRKSRTDLCNGNGSR